MARWLITFPSVYHAFRAERLLGQNKIQVAMVPVPRSLSGSCEGLAAEVDACQVKTAVDILTARGVNILHKGIEVPD